VTLKPPDRQSVVTLIDRALDRLDRLILRPRLTRHAEFALLDIAVGAGTTQVVVWNLPILGNYDVVVSVTCAAAAVGLLTAGVQAGSKSPTGCTIVVANRTGIVIGAATFDVLAFPL
jgi:hypothetical protein